MTAPFLSKGQNSPLPSDALQVDVFISSDDPEAEIDASILLLDERRKVRSDLDFVFYNQPESADCTVRWLGRSVSEAGPQERLAIDLESLPPDVSVVAIAGSTGSRTFGEMGKLGLRIVDTVGNVITEYVTADARDESALVFGELYRRDGGWKVRAVGQGWDTGLAGMAQDFGVDVEDEADVAADSDALPDQQSVDVSIIADPIADEVQTSTRPEVGNHQSKGLTTKRVLPKKVNLPEMKLALADTWHPAPLFSTVGIGGGIEQERRATSALIATMQAVKPFGRAICKRIGLPVGAFEGFLEVPFPKGDGKVIPDAVLRVARAGHISTALLEVKTGKGQLRQLQIENYLDIARAKKFEVVVTLSNDIPASAGQLPVEVSSRKLGKVALRHLSWSEVTHDARMLVKHGGVEDLTQAWMLREFLHYLQHPRSGIAEFVDMGKHWVAVRNAVTNESLRAADPLGASVVESWFALTRHLAFRMTSDLGSSVVVHLPRPFAASPAARIADSLTELASSGELRSVLKIPDTAGDLVITANMRTNRIKCSTKIVAPNEGSSSRRLTWLIKQLSDAPESVLVEAVFSKNEPPTCEKLSVVRSDPKKMTAGRSADLVEFTLAQTFSIKEKSTVSASNFIAAVISSSETFYSGVLQPLKAWVPPAPKVVDGLEPDDGLAE